MTVRHLLPVVLVGEAPPCGGLGPLGPFDCDSGRRLAALDPIHDLCASHPRGSRGAVARTLSLFERVNLLAKWPGPARRAPDATRPHLAPSAADRAMREGSGNVWPKDQAREAWRALAPSLAGRRVALVGRAVEAAGLKGLPPLRWLRLGGEGEPAEACYLPHPSGVCRWYNDGANRAAVGAWIAQVRKEREDADGAWVAIGDGLAYHLIRGQWGVEMLGGFGWLEEVRPDDACELRVRDLLLKAAAGVHRGGGGWALTILDHMLLVADLCSTPGGKRLALLHDLHEPIVGDMASPFKRICRREWRPVERVAQAAVERLLGLDPTPAEREEVRRADRLALLVEARQVGVDLGDPDAEFDLRAPLARLRADQLAQTHATPANWLRAWSAAG